MSKSSVIVAQSLLNRHFVPVKIGFLQFRAYQPFIRDLTGAFADKEAITIAVMLPEASINTISRLLFKHPLPRRIFEWYAARYATCDQLRIAAIRIADVVTGKDLFDAVKIDKTKKKTETETVGNNTICGMLTSMLEQLNITYKEAFDSINYPTLLLMMIDKCRSLTGGEQKIVKGSGKNMGARRGAAKKRNQ